MNQKTKELWIEGALLVTQDSSRSIRKGALRILDGKIAEIRTSAPRKTSSRVNVHDFAGKLILPGFVQTHIHLCQTLFRNCADDLDLLSWLKEKIWPMEAAHTKESLRASAELGIWELLSGGTTCILDMGTVRHTEVIFETAKRMGIRANIGKCLMDHPTLTPENLREGTNEALKEAEALFTKWNGTSDDRIRASFAPRFALSCTEELLKKVVGLSKKHGALIHTHAAENQNEVEMVRNLGGKGNIHYLNQFGLLSNQLVLAHGIWLEEDEVKMLAHTGTHLSHCPSSNLKLGSGIAKIPELIEAGVSVSLGADGAPCNNRLDAFTEMRLAALLPKARLGPRSMPAQEALDLATRNGARALGWEDQIGSLEVGKDADFMVLDPLNDPGSGIFPQDLKSPQGMTDLFLSSLVYAGTCSQVVETWVQGARVYKNVYIKKIETRGITPFSLLKKAETQRSRILVGL